MDLAQHDTTRIVVEREGKFLLVKRARPPEKGFWAVPGGHVEKGETVLECAQRECSEEVGPALVEKKPFLVFVHDVGIGHRHRAHIFKGTLSGKPRAGSDAEEVQWLSLKEMESLELTHYTKNIFNFLLFGDIRK